MARDIYDIGSAPPLGEVPGQMWAQVIRPERFGEPETAFKVERMDVPEVGPHDALVWVAAAGINYNNVWAARGVPIDVCEVHGRLGEPSDFHIGGSDASGIVYAVGDEVTNVKVGDRVVIHCGAWDVEGVPAGLDPMFHPSYRIWGYETNWGSFAQFTKVQAHQCMPKAEHLSWEAAAACTLVGATAWRMLMGWPPHTVQPDDVVLIWGGSGGLGSMAIQIVREQGGIPVAVVSTDERGKFCMDLGAKGYVLRTGYDHFGRMPDWSDDAGYAEWSAGCRAFGKAVWEVLGERRSPRIVFEHPGQSTIPTSMFVCDTGGMVVICAGTTGYNADVDLRYVWMRQKRLQGSHFANDEQSYAFNDLVRSGRLDPCLGDVFSFEDIWKPHQLMFENRHSEGNMAALVGVREPGRTDLDL
ncbi:MAG TPA: crotonyl-CoA carboxylase/reductase [Actinomycetota bacterium]|nr:crotonyl-CoA carboxylase/reductase [Actinomycetota bacterium]